MWIAQTERIDAGAYLLRNPNVSITSAQTVYF